MMAALLALMSGADSEVDIVNVKAGSLVAFDGGVTDVQGGVWLSDHLAIERAMDLQRLSDQNKRLLQQQPQPQPAPPGVAIALVVGLAGGLATGFLLCLALR